MNPSGGGIEMTNSAQSEVVPSLLMLGKGPSSRNMWLGVRNCLIFFECEKDVGHSSIWEGYDFVIPHSFSSKWI